MDLALSVSLMCLGLGGILWQLGHIRRILYDC